MLKVDSDFKIILTSLKKRMIFIRKLVIGTEYLDQKISEMKI